MFAISIGTGLAKGTYVLPDRVSDGYAIGTSGDGAAVIGASWDPSVYTDAVNGSNVGWLWTPSQGYTFFTNPWGNPLVPSVISVDGKTVAGKFYMPHTWDGKPAWDGNGDWNYIHTAIWRWTERGGVQILAPPQIAEGTSTPADTNPLYMSDDATAISGNLMFGDGWTKAFLWNATDGFVDVSSMDSLSQMTRDGRAAWGIRLDPNGGYGTVYWTASGGLTIGPSGPFPAGGIVPIEPFAAYFSDPTKVAKDHSEALDGSVRAVTIFDEALDPAAGYAHWHAEVIADRPVIEKLTPAEVVAGSPDVTVSLYGLGFEAGSRVFFGLTEVAATLIGPLQLQVAIPAAALPAPQDFATIPITILCPGGDVSKPAAFTVIGSAVSGAVGQVQSTVAAAGETASAQTPPSTPNDAGVTATLENSAGTMPATVTAATYTQNPTPAKTFEAGGGFVDLQVSGADAGDRLMSSFYYPQTVTAAAESALTLKFYNGSVWIDVISSGGASPIKSTTDNLDGTVSGGRFQVVFDNTSTPKITELNGTVFAVAVPDTLAPTVSCPNVTAPASADALVPVTYPAPTVHDNVDAAPTVTYSIASGSGFPVGTTTVTCTATDAAGNASTTTFTVTRAPLAFTGFLSPVGGADSTGGSYASPLRTFKAGSTIPLKFTAQASGTAVTTGIHRLQAIKYTSATTAGTPIDATPQDAATIGDQFRCTSGQWQFNLDTKATGLTTGIWLLRATLSDGSQHSAWVQMK